MTPERELVERPILFSGPMVRAILDGRKTQTRRVVKDLPDDTAAVRWVENERTVPDGCYTGWAIECGAPLLLPLKCPYGVPGDRLWGRETWCRESSGGETIERSVLYAATARHVIKDDGDGGTVFNKDGTEASPWRPSIHMPRWASRLTLEITDVRVQRVQDISEEDAKAEGCAPTCESCRLAIPQGEFDLLDDTNESHWACDEDWKPLWRDGYRVLWDSLNAKRGYGWDANPWVWVVEFKRLLP